MLCWQYKLKPFEHTEHTANKVCFSVLKRPLIYAVSGHHLVTGSRSRWPGYVWYSWPNVAIYGDTLMRIWPAKYDLVSLFVLLPKCVKHSVSTSWHWTLRRNVRWCTKKTTRKNSYYWVLPHSVVRCSKPRFFSTIEVGFFWHRIINTQPVI